MPGPHVTIGMPSSILNIVPSVEPGTPPKRGALPRAVLAPRIIACTSVSDLSTRVARPRCIDERVIELAVRFDEKRLRGFGVLPQAPADHSEPECQGNESLLRAVVQVSLQTSALGVTCLDDPDAGRGELPVCIGVRQRLRDELGEVGETAL